MAESSAIESAVRSERTRLLDFIRRRVRTQEDAEDILQDVFYQLLTSYSVTEPIEKLVAWLFAVARNRIIDWYRKKKNEPLPKAGGETSLDDWPAGTGDNPDEVFQRNLTWETLAEALSDLPAAQRDVFIMHEIEGRSFNEIAEITGVPLNTLLSRKRYAVLSLRERMQELAND